MFDEFTNCHAIIASKGKYYQLGLASLRGCLYAKIGSAFIRLYADKSTSLASHTIVLIERGVLELYKDEFGRLYTKKVEQTRSLSGVELMELEIPKGYQK